MDGETIDSRQTARRTGLLPARTECTLPEKCCDTAHRLETQRVSGLQQPMDEIRSNGRTWPRQPRGLASHCPVEKVESEDRPNGSRTHSRPCEAVEQFSGLDK
jgi:hypothetical protein